jgi:dihydrofolate synthase/folylpolyglutamate synthase
MTYPETITYLDSFINYEKKAAYPYKESFKLERIEEFLKVIDNPQDSLKCIHIAGTKGKGSVCAFCAYILKEAGYKVGLYTSPHLSEVRERIRILNSKFLPVQQAGKILPLRNLITQAGSRPYLTTLDGKNSKINLDFEGMIAPEELEGLVEELKPKIDDYSKNSIYGPLSFFEIYTSLAFTYFKEKNVDFAVLETGLGGKLDATNIVEPLICGITSISYDHTNKLGNTLTEIAGEKAGIIKSQKSIVVTAPQEAEVLIVLKDRCAEQDAILYEIGKDIFFEQTSFYLDFQDFNVRGILGEHNNLKIRLLGKHQLINATLAVSLIDVLIKSNQMRVKSEDIKKGLYNTVWPGRFEIVSQSPLIVLDGAHNDASVRTLRQTLEENYPDKNITIILGISRDKDIKGICRELAPIGKRFILTKADNPRAFNPEEVLSYMSIYKPKESIIAANNIKEALSLAAQEIDTDSLIVVTGSLFLVGEARDILKPKT